jgi:parallel beta-helix repeat protein
MALGPSDNATITGNTVNGAREGGISFVNSDTAIIENNTITNVAGDGWSVGALSLKDGPSNVTARYNTIYDNAGTWGGYNGTGHGIGIDGVPSNIVLNLNNLYGNSGYQAYNASSVSVDGKCNWWGDAAGPGTVDVDGPIDVATWLDGPYPGGNCVPEPATMLAVGAGVAGLAGLRRKRRMARDA